MRNECAALGTCKHGIQKVRHDTYSILVNLHFSISHDPTAASVQYIALIRAHGMPQLKSSTMRTHPDTATAHGATTLLDQCAASIRAFAMLQIDNTDCDNAKTYHSASQSLMAPLHYPFNIATYSQFRRCRSSTIPAATMEKPTIQVLNY